MPSNWKRRQTLELLEEQTQYLIKASFRASFYPTLAFNFFNEVSEFLTFQPVLV